MELNKQNTAVTGWLPPPKYIELPDTNKDYHAAGVNHFLSPTTTTLMRRRKTKLAGSPFPVGPDDTRPWVEKYALFQIKFLVD